MRVYTPVHIHQSYSRTAAGASGRRRTPPDVYDEDETRRGATAAADPYDPGTRPRSHGNLLKGAVAPGTRTAATIAARAASATATI